MTEPELFRTEEARDNYIKDTTRQFRWLLHKYESCHSLEQTVKAREKLFKFCDKHPTFTKALHIFLESRKDKVV